MALGSWQGLYNAVVLDLMAQHREQELLLLMAIASHADPFGFCYPGRARQTDLRHCAKSTQRKNEAWLVANGLLTVEDVFNPRRRQEEPEYQVSPRAIYVREDLQAYCEAVFDGERTRDFAFENKVLVILRSTKESQPEEPESESEPESKPETSVSNQRKNQRGAKKQNARTTTTMRSVPPDQREAQSSQRRKAQDRKIQPPGGVSGEDGIDALLSPTVPDEQVIDAIRSIATTTPYQAADAVATYPRDAIVHWLRATLRRRRKGELKNPGGWFFRMLQENVAPTAYQDFEFEASEDAEEF